MIFQSRYSLSILLLVSFLIVFCFFFCSKVFTYLLKYSVFINR